MDNSWKKFDKASQGAKDIIEAEFEVIASSDTQAQAEQERKMHAEAARQKTEKNEIERKAREEYKENLEDLFETYKELASAKDFTEIFSSLKDDSLDDAAKEEALKEEFKALQEICDPDKNGNPDNEGKTSDEVRKIANQATALLEFFYVESLARISSKSKLEAKEKREKLQDEAKLEINEKIFAAKGVEDAFCVKATEKVAEEKKQAEEEQKRRVEEEQKKQDEKKIKAEEKRVEEEKKKQEAEAAKKPEEKKENVKDVEEEKLLDELRIARDKFADTEFRDRTTMQRLRKYFNNGKDQAPGSKYADNANIKTARDSHHGALKGFMNHKIGKLQKDGVTGPELEAKVKELYSFFNLDETVKYYDARTEAKMNYLASDKNKDGSEKGFLKKGWDKMNQGMIKMSEWYSKKVPTSVKVALALGAFIPGASAFAIGKRAWGASMMAVSGGALLDQYFQRRDGKVDKKQRNKEFRNVSENGNVDFDKLKGLLDGKIGELDHKLNKKSLLSSCNKFLAFTGALFSAGSILTSVNAYASAGKEVASTTAIGNIVNWAKGLWGHGSENAGTVNAVKHVTTAVGADVKGASFDPSKVDPNSLEGRKHLIPGAGKVPEKLGVNPHGTAAVVGAHSEVAAGAHSEINKPLTIEIKNPVNVSEGHVRHDSFIRSLKDHLKSTNSEIHPEAAETVFHDAAKEYAASHNISYTEAVKKLSKINPGTTYTLTQDAKGLHMHIDDEHVKFVKSVSGAEHHAPVAAAADHGVNPIEQVNAPQATNDEFYRKFMHDTAYDNLEKQPLPANFAEPVPEHNGIYDYEFGPTLDAEAATEAAGVKGGFAEYVMAENYKGAIPLRKDFFDGSMSKFKSFENVNVNDAISDRNGASLHGLSRKARKLITAFSELVKPEDGENFKHYTGRIVILAKEAEQNK